MSGYFSDSKTKDLTFRCLFDGIDRNAGIVIPTHSSVYSYRTGSRAVRSQTNEEILLSATRDTRQPGIKSLESSLGKDYDTGHEFNTKKQEFLLSHPDVFIQGRNGHYYKGPLLLKDNADIPSQYRGFTAPDPADIVYYGQQFIERSVPTRPEASISQFLGELNRLPTFLIDGSMRRIIDVARLAGDQYLNVSFGWKPFIGDLVKYIGNLLTLQSQLDQFFRDSGRNVRRRRENPTTFTSEEKFKYHTFTGITYCSYGSIGGPHLYNVNGDGSEGDVFVNRTVRETYKFSGAFTYYAEAGDDLWSQLRAQEQLARKLLGVELSPYLLYQLAPYSWLVDWVANLGTAIAVAQAFTKDGLVMRYGYLQRETVVENVISLAGWYFYAYNPGVVSNTFRTTWKERFRATPYGFALNPNQFSVGQWAILAALGLTKAPRILRQY